MRGVSAAAMDWALRWRTRRERATVVRYLDVLAVATRRKGWRCVELYRKQALIGTEPLLWVYARGTRDDVGLVVTVYAEPGGCWAYYDAGRGRRGYLVSCGDALGAADHIDQMLKHQAFPDTFAMPKSAAGRAR
jgi:hypothetical protein